MQKFFHTAERMYIQKFQDLDLGGLLNPGCVDLERHQILSECRESNPVRTNISTCVIKFKNIPQP
jgi:hypothetical protein